MPSHHCAVDVRGAEADKRRIGAVREGLYHQRLGAQRVQREAMRRGGGGKGHGHTGGKPGTCNGAREAGKEAIAPPSMGFSRFTRVSWRGLAAPRRSGRLPAACAYLGAARWAVEEHTARRAEPQGRVGAPVQPWPF